MEEYQGLDGRRAAEELHAGHSFHVWIMVLSQWLVRTLL